jgi:hypothetical protein
MAVCQMYWTPNMQFWVSRTDDSDVEPEIYITRIYFIYPNILKLAVISQNSVIEENCLGLKWDVGWTLVMRNPLLIS